MKIKLKYVAIIIGIAFVFSIAITSGGGTMLETYGIEGYYSQIEDFIPFALVYSDKLNCQINHKVNYIDDAGTKRPLVAGGLEVNVIPVQKNDILSTPLGKKVKSIDGELTVRCPSSTVIDPVLSEGGLFGFQIFAMNQKGETIKVKDSGFMAVPTGSVDGKSVLIGKWSILASELENMIGTGTTDYTTILTTNAYGTLNFKEKQTDMQVWKYNIKGDTNGAVKFKVIPRTTTNLIDDLTGLKQRKVELTLSNSDNAVIDTRKTDRLTVVGSLYDWDQGKEGNPILSLYYIDPKNSLPSERVTPLKQSTLTSYSGKTGAGNVADFSYSMYLGKSPKLGEYKVTFSSALQNGKPIRDTVASITFKVIKTVPTCEETKSCPPPKEEQPPTEDITPSSELDKIQECIKTGNIQCILTNSGIPINIISGLVVFIVLIIIIAIAIAVAKRPPRPLPRY